MGSRRSVIISLSLPLELLAQVDELAKREFETRSGVIRRAARKYVRESGVGEITIKEEMPPPKRDYEKLAKKYPYVQPGDTKLLEVLDDQDNNRL